MYDRDLGAPNMLDLLAALFDVIAASSAVVDRRGIAMDQDVEPVMNPPSAEGSSTEMHVETDRRTTEAISRAPASVVNAWFGKRSCAQRVGDALVGSPNAGHAALRPREADAGSAAGSSAAFGTS